MDMKINRLGYGSGSERNKIDATCSLSALDWSFARTRSPGVNIFAYICALIISQQDEHGREIQTKRKTAVDENHTIFQTVVYVSFTKYCSINSTVCTVDPRCFSYMLRTTFVCIEFETTLARQILKVPGLYIPGKRANRLDRLIGNAHCSEFT